MKVLFLAHYFHPRIGGVEKHVYKVSKELIKNGIEVTVLTSRYDKKLKHIEDFEGIKIYRVDLSADSWLKPPKLELWFTLIQKYFKLFLQADLIHCHDVFFWYLPIRFILPFKPIFTTFHGYEGISPPAKKAILIRKISEKLSWGNVCVGSYIEKWYGTRANEIVYAATEIPEKIKDFKNDRSVLFLGRLDPDTGLLTYLDALEILKQKGIDLKVESVGGGKLEKKFKKYGKLLSFQTGISKYLFRNRYAFFSSYLTIAEAFAHKRLVFAVYDNPLKKDVLLLTPFKDYLIITNSPTELAQKIEYYLSNHKEEKQIIDIAFKWVKKQTWKNLANSYFKLWKSKGVYATHTHHHRPQ